MFQGSEIKIFNKNGKEMYSYLLDIVDADSAQEVMDREAEQDSIEEELANNPKGCYGKAYDFQTDELLLEVFSDWSKY